MNEKINHNQNEKDTIAYRKKLRRRRARKRKRRRRILSLSVLLLLFLLIVVKFVSCSSNKKNTTYAYDIPEWMMGQVVAKEEKLPISMNSHLGSKNFFNKAYFNASSIEITLKPQSNHLTSADSYAYDTKLIREYIRGEKEYKGKEKLVFLTFDDGPSVSVTPQILNTLAKNGVHGTFFVPGKSISKNTEALLKRELLDGHAIGGHSFSHDYHTLYPGRVANPVALESEVKATQKKMQEILGDDFYSKVFRYPGGHMSWSGMDQDDAVLERLDIQWIDWNCLSGDAEPKRNRPTTPQGQVDFVKTSLAANVHQDVAVVLMHDAKDKQLTADSLQGIIDYFKENNYKFCILE